jgi:hypothetical protein
MILPNAIPGLSLEWSLSALRPTRLARGRTGAACGAPRPFNVGEALFPLRSATRVDMRLQDYTVSPSLLLQATYERQTKLYCGAGGCPSRLNT